MNVVDSCAWLAWFADEPNSDHFADAITSTEELLVPSICIYEVSKVILRETGRPQALQAIAQMRQGTVVELDDNLAANAAQVGLDQKLAMADAIILTTAIKHNATLWTQDDDFSNIAKGIADVRFIKKW